MNFCWLKLVFFFSAPWHYMCLTEGELPRFIPQLQFLWDKKFSSFPPRHVSCEKARWRAVQEPTVPGLSIYNDPRSHKPLPSQWITFSNSTHSKFIYLQLYVHTHSSHTLPTRSPHTHGHTEAASVCSVVTQKKCSRYKAKFCNCSWSVQYNGMHVCVC